MNSIEIRIVGAITDENALEEIEDIAKIFSYEQRMKDYIPVLQIPYQVEKKPIINDKEQQRQTKVIQNPGPRIPVKGLW
ncbi:MAG: hypothetical protein JXA75_07380 [Candidatus Thermoplasmatota archaeon]|nr:hypothetical protein [Candidatus Thermoplasmatota archaeon]